MLQVFDTKLDHAVGTPNTHTAAHTVITQDDFADAWNEIVDWQGYTPTPLVSFKSLANAAGVGALYYKDEGPRFGLGSFKALGGSYAALKTLAREISRIKGEDVALADIRQGKYAEECAEITLVSATDGNHGRSLAWGCQRFGVPCRIYIHAEVSEGRAQAMRDLGAHVVRIKGDYDQSVIDARTDAEENGWFVVSDTSWEGYTKPPRDVMAGYGVMTREIFEALPKPPTHVFLQGGVGGLAAGVAASFRQLWGEDAPRVIVVEPELAACLIESSRKGEPTTVHIEDETIMAGLSCGEPSGMAWSILSEETSDFLTIPDKLVGPTVRLLANPIGSDQPIKAGESAVAGLAAVLAARSNHALSVKLGLDGTARVLLIGSEGITDPDIFERIMNEEL